MHLHVRRDFLRNSITVVFSSIYGTASITLHSKFTCISGDNSGEGKTEFLSMLDLLVLNGECTITASDGRPVVIITSHPTLQENIKHDYSEIILIDELMFEQANIISSIVKSNKLIICVSRSYPLKGEYPLIGIYNLKRKDDWFELINDEHLPILSESDIPTKIVTEASNCHSENELLSIYFDMVTSSNGRDKLERKLRYTTEPILVFADLGNIGRALYLLKKRCEENPNIRFYDYQAFEELLFKSSLVQGTDDKYPQSSLDFMSLETYYEKALEEITKGTSLEYHHGKPLVTAYLDKSNCQKIFDTDIGRPLYKLIQGNETFNCVEYLKSQLGDNLSLISSVAIEACVSKEDCDELIQSVLRVIAR